MTAMSEVPEVLQVDVAWWAKFALIGGIIATILLLLGPLGFRLGILDVGTAVLVMPALGTALAVPVLGFAVVGMVLVLRRGLVAERLPLAIGGALALMVLMNMLLWAGRGGAAPPIHDISTDTVNPPQFVTVAALRDPSDNTLDYDRTEVAALTLTHYESVQPIVSPLEPREAFDRSLAVANDLGWKIKAADADAGHIEATDTTRFYGFKDDVVIRIRSQSAGSRIDLRSASRVGQSDLGANATRILAFTEAFTAD